MIADVEEMENLDSSEIHPRRAQCKRSVNATKERETFRFQTADGA